MIGCFGLRQPPTVTVTLTNAAGTIDVRYLNTGATLTVPVFNDGALLSAAEGHALQGEGEISGTAIECLMQMTLQVDLIPDAGLEAPELTVPATDHADEGYRIFTGIGPDLMTAARDAPSAPSLSPAHQRSRVLSPRPHPRRTSHQRDRRPPQSGGRLHAPRRPLWSGAFGARGSNCSVLVLRRASGLKKP